MTLRFPYRMHFALRLIMVLSLALIGFAHAHDQS